MAIVAITSTDERNARSYVQALPDHAAPRTITPGNLASPCDTLLSGVGALCLAGGPDVDPLLYGESPHPQAGLEISRELDLLELGLLQCALKRDMPVLAIGRGMQLLNVAFGGSLLQDIPGHRVGVGPSWEPAQHSVYLSPGSKLAAILGNGGFVRIKCRHHQGLREAQKSPRLLASAYAVEDHIIEAVESPEHAWVVGVQSHPERAGEVPRAFANLFAAFGERAEAYVGPA